MTQPTGIDVTFLGAAGEVTGSCYRVETERARFLVECGMFQGGRDADDKNAAALDFDVRALDFVVITHAHIDHSGLLPRLAARGFNGPVYATPATIDLLGVMLPDSAYIHEMEFARAHGIDPRQRGRQARVPNRSGRRDERVDAPLYTVADAERSLTLLAPVAYDRTFDPKASAPLPLPQCGSHPRLVDPRAVGERRGRHAQARVLRRPRPARSSGDGRPDADRRRRRRRRRIDLWQPAAQVARHDL